MNIAIYFIVITWNSSHLQNMYLSVIGKYDYRTLTLHLEFYSQTSSFNSWTPSTHAVISNLQLTYCQLGNANL
jgi:hypothetical protein